MQPLDVARREVLAMLAEWELGDDDGQFVADMIEGSTDFNEVVAAMARKARELEAMAEALKKIESENQARRERFVHSAQRIRDAIGRAMLDVGLKKLTAPDLTIGARMGAPRLKVVSEDLLPAEFRRTKVVSSPDMEKISDYAADHTHLPPGVVRTNGQPIVTLRSK